MAQDGDPTKLNDLQIAFCREYVKDRDPVAAAKRAGYSNTTVKRRAHEFLGNPNVVAYISQLMGETSMLAELPGDNVVAELARIAFTNINEVIKWDADNGVVLVRSSDGIHESAMSSIASIRERSQTFTNKHGKESTQRFIEVKLHDKLAALDKLARIKGLFQDTVEVKGEDAVSKLLEAVDGKTHGRLPGSSTH